MVSQSKTRRRCGETRSAAELAAAERGHVAADIQVIGLRRDTARVLRQFDEDSLRGERQGLEIDR